MMPPMAPSRRRIVLAAAATLILSGCAAGAPSRQIRPRLSAPSLASPGGDPDLAAAIDGAAGATTDAALASLLREHWAWRLSQSPTTASSYGIHAYDDRLDARGPDASARARADRDVFLGRAEALDIDAMSEGDRVTARMFLEELRGAREADACEFETWTLSPRSNPVTEFNYLPELHELDTPEDAAIYLARVRAIPAAIDQTLASLRVGATAGRFANLESSTRVLAMVRAPLEQPLARWPLMSAATRYDARDAGDAGAFRAALTLAIEEGVRPALGRYADFIEQDVLPSARGDEAPGLSSLPIGAQCYAALVRSYTTLPRTAQEVHEVGMREIEAINEEMRELGERLFQTRDLAEILERLRTDPALYFTTRDEVQQAAQDILDDAAAAMPRFFSREPQAACRVVPIPDYEAPFTTIAYYREPNPDGSKPGEYFINTLDPTTRPRYEARVLGVHEAIPGHHLQIAISQELPDLPAFRKYGGMTVFVEGWALYTERMAEEMGLYRNDLDRMGVLSFDAWRASRLVVDTGLHAMGWSREQAKQFMLEHTALAPNNIDNEVDRYIVWPGQALAYKTGQLEIWALRRQAEAALGERFDLAEFHTAVLSGGAVTLGILEDQVQAWVERRRDAPTP